MFQAYDVDSAVYRTLITMTANNNVTLDLAYVNSLVAVANLDIGAFDLHALTLTSDVVTGTAPLTVASITLVTNLNAEHWNDKHLGAVTDGKLVRYNSTGTQMETGTVAEAAGALSAITTLGMAGDLTDYELVNDGSPEFRLGSANAEELHIQSVYDAGAQTLSHVLFQTDVASATADKGQFKFNVDGTEIFRIDDGGVEVVGTVMATLGFVPDADNGAYLGVSGTAFSDLFLASGAVIDFAAGNATITHSTGILTFNVFPVTPSSAPDADYEVANKKYVDDSTATVNSLSEILALGNTTGANNIVVSDTQQINTGVVDDDYFTLGAVANTPNTIAEVARVQGAVDPYFSTGASQQFKFYSSGTALFGSLVTSDAATIEIGAGGVIKSGATNADTLLIAANDTTFITLTTGATDLCDLASGVTIGGVYIYRAGGTDVAVADGGTGASTLTDGGLLVGAGTGAVEVLAVGLTTQILVGGGAGINPAWGTDLPTAVTIGTKYVYRAEGTDVPVADGGTGLSTFAAGSVVVANALDTISAVTSTVGLTVLKNDTGTISWNATTGTGSSVMATSPTLVTPTLGVAIATSINKVTITTPATSAILTIADGKTLTVNNSIILNGTDAQTYTFPSTSCTVAGLQIQQTFSKGQTITIADTVNQIPLTINMNDITNNNFGLSVTSASISNYAGAFFGRYPLLANQTVSNGYALDCRRNIDEAGSDFVAKFKEDHANNTSGAVKIQNDGIGNGLFIDQNANGLSLYIDKDCTVNDTRTWAAKIDSDNAGTGTALGCGIDMSSFATSEPLLKVPTDATAIATSTTDSTGRIAIDIGGTTYYVPYF